MVVNINTHGVVITHDISNAEPINCSLYYNGVRSYSTLYVDENDILQFVDKDFKPEDRYEGLGFGQSFNGKEISTI